MIKKLVCIQCPLGCEITVKFTENMKIMEIYGNRCPKGYDYALEEITDPKRILTTSVKVENGEIELASVKTNKPIPKKLLKEAMKVLKKIRVKAPVRAGDIVLCNLLGTGADVIATRTVESKASNNQKANTNSKQIECNIIKI